MKPNVYGLIERNDAGRYVGRCLGFEHFEMTGVTHEEAETRLRAQVEKIGDDLVLEREFVALISLSQEWATQGSTPSELEAPSRYWNLRVIEFAHGDERWSSVHEVHYKDGRPIAYSEKPASMFWTPDDDPGAAERCIERIRRALTEPALKAIVFLGAIAGATADIPEDEAHRHSIPAEQLGFPNPEKFAAMHKLAEATVELISVGGDLNTRTSSFGLLDLRDLASKALLRAPVPDANEYLVGNLRDLAVDVFSDEDEALAWLDRPHSMLDGQTPIHVARSHGGLPRVKGILAAIKFGGVL